MRQGEAGARSRGRATLRPRISGRTTRLVFGRGGMMWLGGAVVEKKVVTGAVTAAACNKKGIMPDRVDTRHIKLHTRQHAS